MGTMSEKQKEYHFNEMNEDMDDEIEIITLEDDEGNSVEFIVIATLKLDDTEYAILAEKEDPTQIMAFRVIENGDDFELEGVEDDEELDQVILAFAELQEE